MEITCYKNRSGPDVLNKLLTNMGTRNVTVYGEQSIDNPSLILEDVSVPDFNYVYIPEYRRYYYCNVHLLQNGIYIVNCSSVDPLMSFKNSILGLMAIINKTGEDSKSNRYINDGSFVSESSDFVQTYRFRAISGVPEVSFLTTPVNVLICAGGGEVE